ncbi:Hypp5254 [Branchiostoma lanceolatum]|uniref:Hypp5254 protein n=1 Tax=Branchiostoma lanceolatum TaxID=7740 RepID=A0A8K0AEJ2_BRALA|nr:Hypp5254 [Branchiostoma lanceolatum]
MKTMFIVLCLLGGTFALSRDPWWSESSADEYSADDIFANLVPRALSDVEGEPAVDNVYALYSLVPGGVAKRARSMVHSFGPGLRYLLLQPRPFGARGRARGRLVYGKRSGEYYE